MNRRISRVAISAVGALACSLAPSARGQTNDAVLEEVIVSAQKRDISLQDSTVAVTAISGDALQKLNIREINEYIELVPGLTALQRTPETNGPRTVGLRGVQSLNGTFSVGQNTVGFYIDDSVVPISNPRLVDLERIEVLRGPQGTLYGSATLAGTIKLVTAKPDFQNWGGRLRADVSSMTDGGSGYSIEGALNAPISDTLALRVSGYADRIPGYVDFIEVNVPAAATGRIENDANNADAIGGRVVAEWKASPNLSVSLAHMYSKVDVGNLSVFTKPTPDGLPVAGCFAFNQSACPNPMSPIAAVTGRSSDRSDPNVLGRFRTPSETAFSLTSLTFRWQPNDAELVSSTSYYTDEGLFQTEITDIIGATFGRDITVPTSSPPFFAFQPKPVAFRRYLENSELTHETRLVSNWDRPIDYTVGVFYTDRDEDFVTNAPLGVGTFLYGAPNLSADGSALATEGFRGRKERSVFGEVSYDVSERLAVTVGGRYFQHEFKLADTFTGNPLFVGAASGTSSRSDNAKQSGTIGAAKIAFRVNGDSLLYASVAEGFRMGGAVFRLPEDVPSCRQEIIDVFGSPTAPRRFEPDDLVNYEIGWKQTWNDGRATSNAAVFFIDWNNTQVVIPGSVCNIVGFPVNAGAVESRGVELEAQALLFKNLRVGLNLAYIDSEVTGALTTSPNVTPIAVRGDLLPGIPEWSGSLTWDFSPEWTRSFGGYFRGVLSYRDDTVVAIGNNANLADSYTLLNLRLGAVVRDGWDVAVYVNNAFDERPSLTGPISLDPEPNAFRNEETTLPPRTIGISVSKSFN